MLDVSSLSAKDPDVIRSQSFDLTDVICQTLLSLESRILDRSLDVDADLPEEPIWALGDRDAITQVVYNLLDNAAKFADPGSVIRISLWKRNDRAYVSIADHGPTIPEEELPLIFDRFHKSDKSRSMDVNGVGLGLNIVKSIIKLHGGKIQVRSIEKEYTEFIFSLPNKDIT